MDKNWKIIICGLDKALNKAFVRYFRKEGFSEVSGSNEDVFDLTSQDTVKSYFSDYKPDLIIFTGSVSGGIAVNIQQPAEFMYKNIITEANVINSAKQAEVKNLIYLASSCVYPKDSPQPLKEEFLLSGSLEETSEPYAVAKICGIKMCAAYNRQYGSNFIAVIPATIYGPEDDFNPATAHVISALIKKIHEAKEKNEDFVEIWGSGTVRREFIFVDDLVDACIFLLDNYNENRHINVGCSKDYTISELVKVIYEVVGFKGKMRYDRSKPEGVKQKLLDSGRIASSGWKSKTSLKEGIGITYKWFKERIE